MSREENGFKKYATEYDPIKIGSIDGTDTEPHDRAIVRAIHSDYTPNKQVKGAPQFTLFVGRLNPRTKQDTIKTEFSKFGKIIHCRLVKDIVTGKSKQYAFIEFENHSSLDKAYREMHQEYIDGAQIIVEREAERRLRGWKPRRLGGGFGGKKESGQLRFGCRDRPFRKPILIQQKPTHETEQFDRNKSCPVTVGCHQSFNNEQALQTMCNVCWREFKGWCRSYTKTEAWLAALEFILLILCIAFLIFLILHVIVCQSHLDEVNIIPSTETPGSTDDYTESGTSAVPESTTGVTKRPYPTVPPGVQCTWTPSAKTEAVTHYYDTTKTPSTTQSTTPMPATTTEAVVLIDDLHGIDSLAMEDKSDGEDADESMNQFILALVKVKPPRDITFGCILTVISENWTLTAASCIESIEEVDSLDSFVMMEGYGAAKHGRTHAVADVQIHHLYQGANSTYDIAALKCQDTLSVVPVELPTLVNYFLVTVGERFTVLGYGGFRTITKGTSDRALRQVYTYTLPRTQCAQTAGETWSPRHLGPGRPAPHRPCATAPLCSGVLYTRGTPCNYCSGTPLIRNNTLYGIMSDNQQCGVACEPALYVNVAVVRDWIDFVMEGQ